MSLFQIEGLIPTIWISGLSAADAFSMESMRSRKPCEYAEPRGCLYAAFMTAIAIEPPCSVVASVSKGEWRYAIAKSTQPRDYSTESCQSSRQRGGIGRELDRTSEVRPAKTRRMTKHSLTQMSTFSSSIIPVLTSNSSGALYAIVLCSAAMS